MFKTPKIWLCITRVIFVQFSKRPFHHIPSSLKALVDVGVKEGHFMNTLEPKNRKGGESHSEFLKLIIERNPKVLIKIIPTVVITYKCPLLWAYKKAPSEISKTPSLFQHRIGLYICIAVMII